MAGNPSKSGFCIFFQPFRSRPETAGFAGFPRPDLRGCPEIGLAQQRSERWHGWRRIVAALSDAARERDFPRERESARACAAKVDAAVGWIWSMPLFSQDIVDFWRFPFAGCDVLHDDDAFLLAINPALDEDERVTVLETTAGKILAAVTPSLADKAGLDRGQRFSVPVFHQKLDKAGISLHGADYLFYFRESGRIELALESEDVARHLSQRDEAVFSDFRAAASEQDLDDAFVELDHWAVFGSFQQDRLVSAASAYPWRADGRNDARLADIGVLTLAEFRGRGHARKAVRTLARYIYEQGYHPQYRCQTDNVASVALARAAGLALFGRWRLISPDCLV
ncbi:GNAT family N-acetyltransferase [Mesorhizobium sp. UC22_110]|uniref:GNAT family N-acetyltransferase n=1 Tax=Mesorhizobium sp. UC22_110 TaxID=3374552 RepID=UPI0037572F6E